jgi:hypothetical protein
MTMAYSRQESPVDSNPFDHNVREDPDSYYG